MDWTGSDSKKPKISLGGKRKGGDIKDKDEFLKKAAIEREQRALQRQQILAASKIQSFYRGYVVLKLRINEVEMGLEKKIADIIKLRNVLVTMNVAFIPPKNVLYTILRDFNFVKLKSRKVPNLLSIISLLKSSITSESVDTNYFAGLSITTIVQIKSILKMCVTLISNNWKGEKLNDINREAIYDFINLLSDIQRWGAAGRENDSHLMAIQIFQNVKSLFNITRSLLIEGNYNFESNTFLNACFVAIGAKKADVWYKLPVNMNISQSYIMFVQEIFSITCVFNIPCVATSLYAQYLNNSSSFWAALLYTCENLKHLDYSTSDENYYYKKVIGNMLHLSNLKDSVLLTESEIGLLFKFIGVINKGVESLPLTSFKIPSESNNTNVIKIIIESESDEDEDMGVSATEGDGYSGILDEHPLMQEWKASRRKRQQSRAVNKFLDEKLVKQLRILLDSGFISILFDKLLPSSGSLAPSEERREMSLQLCSLYCSILVKWGAVEDVKNIQAADSSFDNPIIKILNALIFSNPLDPITKRMWSLLNFSADMELYVRDSNIASSSPAISSLLTLFCLSFSHLLGALDDEHVFAKQYPFPLNDLKSMVSLFGSLLYRLFWNSNKVNLNEVTLNLMTAACRLYNQLFERNCRHEFCKAEVWHWKGVSPEQFTYSSNNRTAKLVLDVIPQVVPFEKRLEIFTKLLEEDHQNRESRDHGMGVGITIRRDFIYEDSFSAFNGMASEHIGMLKGRFRVTFINEHGLAEAGIDGGGLFKDYIDSLAKKAFDPQYGLFKTTEEHLLYPNSDAVFIKPDNLDHFRFLGRILGKALYEGILVEPQFASFFLNKLLGKNNLTDDLQSLDPTLYHSLMTLKSYTGDWDDLCLFFEISKTDLGDHSTSELIPGGRNIKVTSKNVIRYISLVANYRLNVQAEQQTRAFLSGFQDIIPVKWIKMFTSIDLQHIIGGVSNKIDLNDLVKNMRYSGGYEVTDRWIQWFWEAVLSFSDVEQGLLLKFMTSCSRSPLLGFRMLNPPPSIQRINIAKDSDKLPTSATCMNTLKLPTYTSYAILREKLLYAITSTQGFDLT